MKLNYVVVDAIKYSFSFFNKQILALMRMVLVFVGISIGLGLMVGGSSLLLLQALSNNIWLMVALESPLLAVVGYTVFGMWNVSFITYLLSLERTGSALVNKELKKSWSLRTVKVILFDLIVVLFAGTIVLIVASVAAGAWWFGGMQLALWHRVVLAVVGSLLSAVLFYLYLRLFFTKIIIADTDADIFAALATSWSATRSWFWRLVVMFLVVGLVAACVTAIAAQLSNLLVLLTHGSIAGNLIGNILRVLAALFSMVFVPIVALYYYNYLKVARSLK